MDEGGDDPGARVTGKGLIKTSPPTLPREWGNNKTRRIMIGILAFLNEHPSCMCQLNMFHKVYITFVYKKKEEKHIAIYKTEPKG